jgi:hypothetical protein
MSLRDTILSVQDTQQQTVEVPEWGVTVEVRGMTGTQRSEFIAACVDPKSGMPRFERVYSQIIIACTYDPETGSQVFEATDRDVIDSKSAAATERIAKVALDLSGLGEDSPEQAKNA